jgi:hypothetical protein
MLLAGLHVSTEGIERACAIAREAGALGAKLTGAGGGGCVIAPTVRSRAGARLRSELPASRLFDGDPMSQRAARAVAHANIALAKYWGKSNVEENLTAVPSLSLTLAPLRTVTRVELDSALSADRATLDGEALSGRPLARVVELLDRVRARAGSSSFARVESHNEVPTAAGLASSASGFAALALAALAAAGRRLARSSERAGACIERVCRSLGLRRLGRAEAGARRAERVAPPEHLPVVMLVAVTASGKSPWDRARACCTRHARAPIFRPGSRMRALSPSSNARAPRGISKRSAQRQNRAL